MAGRDPFRVFLGDQAFDAFGKNGRGPGGGVIRAGLGQEEVFFVLQGFAGGPVGSPIGLELVQLLEAFGEHDNDAEKRGEVFAFRRDGKHGDKHAGDHGNGFQPLKPALAGRALFVVPADLIFEAFEGNVVVGWGMIHCDHR